MRTVTATNRRMSQSEVADIAKSHLIARQMCSKAPNPNHTIICYGLDLNTLDVSRKWLYDEEYAVNHDSQKAKDCANKTVLYVNEQQLDAEIKKLRAEEAARLQKIYEEKAAMMA